eukprot:tig00021504_g21977.t1
MFPPEKRKRLLAAQKEDSFCKKLLAFHAEGENPTVCTRGSRRDADPCSPSCAHCLRAKERFARLAGEFSLADDGVIERNPWSLPAGSYPSCRTLGSTGCSTPITRAGPIEARP